MDDGAIDLRSILGLLRRQFPLILSVVAVFVIAAAATVYLMTPIYSATALVLFDPSNKNLLDPGAQLTAASADNARIDSEVEILRSDSILLKVIATEDLAHNTEFGGSGGVRANLLAALRLSQPAPLTDEQAFNQALARLGGATNVQRRGLTYLIAIEVRSANPNTAARLANAMAAVYIEDQLASKVDSIQAARDILQARVIAARNAIVASEGSFDTFIARNIQQISSDSGRTDFVAMQAQIGEFGATRLRTSAAIGDAQAKLAAGAWPELVETLQSQALSRLEQQRRDIANRLATAEAASPVAVELRGQIAAVETSMRATAAEDVAGLRVHVAEAQAGEQQLRSQIRQQVLDSPLSADVLAQLYELQQNAELSRAQYQTLLARSQDMDTQADLQMANSRVVSPALPPRAPASPDRPVILGAAALGALGLGLLFAFFYDSLIGGFTTEEQAEAVLKARVATSIPRSKASPDLHSLADLVVTAPLSMFAESIRRIRAAIDHQIRIAAGERPSTAAHVIMISSTAPNEGKTTIGLALARSYSLSGRSTLLIDCDLRRPSVHRELDIEPSHGLNEFLADGGQKLSLSAVVSTDTLSKATVIVGAHSSQLPTDQLLTSPAFAKLIDAARASYDIVILDTPPIGPVVDGLYIAPFADVIIFAIKWASTSQRDVRKVLASLNAVKPSATTVLTVLSQQNEARNTYRRKYGGYYQSA